MHVCYPPWGDEREKHWYEGDCERPARLEKKAFAILDGTDRVL